MGWLLGCPPHLTPPHKGGLLGGRMGLPWGASWGRTAEGQLWQKVRRFSQAWLPATLRLPSSQTGRHRLSSVPMATGKRTPYAPNPPPFRSPCPGLLRSQWGDPGESGSGSWQFPVSRGFSEKPPWTLVTSPRCRDAWPPVRLLCPGSQGTTAEYHAA